MQNRDSAQSSIPGFAGLILRMLTKKCQDLQVSSVTLLA